MVGRVAAPEQRRPYEPRRGSISRRLRRTPPCRPSRLLPSLFRRPPYRPSPAPHPPPPRPDARRSLRAGDPSDWVLCASRRCPNFQGSTSPRGRSRYVHLRALRHEVRETVCRTRELSTMPGPRRRAGEPGFQALRGERCRAPGTASTGRPQVGRPRSAREDAARLTAPGGRRSRRSFPPGPRGRLTPTAPGRLHRAQDRAAPTPARSREAGRRPGRRDAVRAGAARQSGRSFPPPALLPCLRDTGRTIHEMAARTEKSLLSPGDECEWAEFDREKRRVPASPPGTPVKSGRHSRRTQAGRAGREACPPARRQRAGRVAPSARSAAPRARRSRHSSHSWWAASMIRRAIGRVADGSRPR